MSCTVFLLTFTQHAVDKMNWFLGHGYHVADRFAFVNSFIVMMCK